MSASTIHYRLDLVVSLIDTTTGKPVEERDVRFEKDGQMVHPAPRGSGNYVFVNSGREDHDLRVNVYGYDEYLIPVRYENLDERMPREEVFLIPSENTTKGSPVITFSGKLSGLQSVQAVDLNSTGCCISGFDSRRRIMTLIKSYRSDLEDVYYGLIDTKNRTFEPFVIEKKITEDSVKITRILERPFAVNSPITRIIYGVVGPDGRFCLRVRDDQTKRQFLVRYVVEGEERFAEVDFRDLAHAALT